MKLQFSTKKGGQETLARAIGDILGREDVQQGHASLACAVAGYIVTCTSRQRNEKGTGAVSIRFSLTSGGRRALARAVGEIVGHAAVYDRAPNFSYSAGGYVIDRDGALVCPAGADREETDRLIAALGCLGYIAEGPGMEDCADGRPEAYHASEEIAVNTAKNVEYAENAGSAGSTENTESLEEYAAENASASIPSETGDTFSGAADAAEDEWHSRSREVQAMPAVVGDRLTIGVPDMSLAAISSLGKIVDSKEALFKKALGADSLPVVQDGNRTLFPWFTLTGEDGEIDAYSLFIAALCRMAKTQRRVTAKEREVGNEKFAMRIFLVRLGFVGPEYKQARKILLRNLTGNSSWKNGPPPGNRPPTEGGGIDDE